MREEELRKRLIKRFGKIANKILQFTKSPKYRQKALHIGIKNLFPNLAFGLLFFFFFNTVLPALNGKTFEKKFFVKAFLSH